MTTIVNQPKPASVECALAVDVPCTIALQDVIAPPKVRPEPRPSNSRPIMKLSVKLIETYKYINKV